MAIPETLAQLLTAPGPSGQEARAAAAWRDAASAFGEVSSDVLGSSWVRVPGTAGGLLLAIVGHIDEIAAVATHAGDDGLIALRALGGFDPHVLLGQRVEVLAQAGSLPGVVGSRRQRRKPGEERKPLSIEDLYLDVGARDGEEARSLVRPGDAAVVAGGPLELRNDRIVSRSLDNRLGSYVALEAARRIAAEGGAPGEVIHPHVFELLYETAHAEEIPFTIEVSRAHTNTDADAVYLSRHGVPTGLVSIPLRYMHTPVEMVQLDDVEAVVRLLVAFARRLEPGKTFER